MITVILGIVAAGMYIIKKWDRPAAQVIKWRIWIFQGAMLELAAILFILQGENFRNCLLLSVFGGCILLACVTDRAICQVYNFVWWIGLTAGILFLWCTCGAKGDWIQLWEAVQSLLLFGFLQLLLFRRMYGRADCYAFFVCAVVEAALGFDVAGFLVHMLLAYVLLFPIQALRGNISRKGNLKEPVPFLPYIAVSFWVVLIVDAYHKLRLQDFMYIYTCLR